MLSAAKRISKTSNRDLKANSLFFIITNLVLFVNYIGDCRCPYGILLLTTMKA